MSRFLQYVISGIVSGSIIALLAASIVMVHRATRVLSFAQGAIASLATYVYFQLQTLWGWPALVALPVAVLAGAVIGAGTERVAMRPLRGTDALTRTVATLGVVLVLQVVMRLGWGGEESFVQRIATGGISVGAISIGAHELLIIIVAVGAALGLGAWLRSSYGGLGLSAIAEDRDAARSLGVDAGRAAALAWGIGGALAALAGVLVTPTLVLNPMQMTLIMVTAFGAALLGAFQSIALALIGGLLIGVVQNLVVGYVNVAGLADAFGFIAVFAILMLTRGRSAAPAPARGAA